MFKNLKKHLSFDPVKRIKIHGVEYKHFKGFWKRKQAEKLCRDLEKGGSRRFPPVVKEVRVSPWSRKSRFYVCIPIINGGK